MANAEDSEILQDRTAALTATRRRSESERVRCKGRVDTRIGSLHQIAAVDVARVAEHRDVIRAECARPPSVKASEERDLPHDAAERPVIHFKDSKVLRIGHAAVAVPPRQSDLRCPPSPAAGRTDAVRQAGNKEEVGEESLGIHVSTVDAVPGSK